MYVYIYGFMCSHVHVYRYIDGIIHIYTPILGRVISICSFDPFPHNTPDNLMFLFYFILCMHLVILSLYVALLKGYLIIFSYLILTLSKSSFSCLDASSHEYLS